MNLSERQEGLLRLVDDYREQECRRILEAARKEAAALIAQAFRKQRAYLHGQVLAERSRAQSIVEAARAERATQLRRTGDRTNLELLQQAWPLVGDRLQARWQVTESRQRWARTYLRRALDLLPHGRWTVRHAPEWQDHERHGVLPELTEALGQAPRFQSDDGIKAGLIIASGGAVLDASLEGLLRGRDRLEARLLALFAARRRG